MTGGGLHLFTLTGGPLQLVSAIDAVRQLQLPDSDCVLVTTERSAASDLVAEVAWRQVGIVRDYVVHRPYGAVRRSSLREYRSLFAYRRVVDDVLGTGSVETHYLGFYGLLTRAINHRVRPRSSVLLDDGTATIIAADRRKADLAAGRRSPDARAKRLARRFIGFDGDHVAPLRFYSQFAPALGEADRLTECTLASFRRRLADAREPDSAWVIGSKVYLLTGGVQSREYFALVNSVVARLRGGGSSSIRYLADPSEDTAELARRLPEGVVIEPGSEPLEFRVLGGLRGPTDAIVGFLTSATVSLSNLYPDVTIQELMAPAVDAAVGERLRTAEDHILALLESNGRNVERTAATP